MKTPSRVWIIWYGQFGQFIHALINQYAPHLDVIACDKHDSREKLLSACTADLIFLAVPIRVFEEVLTTIIPHITRDSMLIEVCTTKVYPYQLLQKHASHLNYLSTHPMFGPYSYQKVGSLKDLRLVICDTTLDSQTSRAIEQFLSLLQLKVIRMAPETHDKLLAQTLFLTHYITQTVIEADLTRTDIDTISFGNLMDVIESVTHDKALFKDVRTYNPYCQQTLEAFHEAQQQVETTLMKDVWKWITEGE